MRWWQQESSRQLLAIPPMAVGLLVPGDTLLKALAAFDGYSVGYLLLTWLAARGRDPAALREFALATRRPRRSDGLLTTTPAQLSQGAAAIAMVATVIAMPKARTLGASPELALTVCIVTVVASLLVLHTGFLVVYLGLHAEGGGFDFPGDDEPELVDFVYFTTSVGTTFGTTDVTVTQSRVRRQVLVHAALSFLFNTLILAVAVTILTSYIAT